MLYPDHFGIHVENTPGVCMAGRDTLAIAECAGAIPARNAIDVGTGTGFIAIYLAKAGLACVATDICERALRSAEDNIARNGVDVSCIRSDLFEQVSGSFDVITFSTPLVAIRSTYSGITRSIRKRFPKTSSRVAHLSFLRARRSRMRMLKDFERGVLAHSNERTHVVLLLHRSEVSHFSRYAPRVHASHGYFDVIVFKPAAATPSAFPPERAGGGAARPRERSNTAGSRELAAGRRLVGDDAR